MRATRRGGLTGLDIGLVELALDVGKLFVGDRFDLGILWFLGRHDGAIC